MDRDRAEVRLPPAQYWRVRAACAQAEAALWRATAMEWEARHVRQQAGLPAIGTLAWDDTEGVIRWSVAAEAPESDRA